jgi:hypothetical protein
MTISSTDLHYSVDLAHDVHDFDNDEEKVLDRVDGREDEMVVESIQEHVVSHSLPGEKHELLRWGEVDRLDCVDVNLIQD